MEILQYLATLLLSFIGLLLLMQLIFFELTRNKVMKSNNMMWFLSLDRPFTYTRVKYMFFICLICYLISSPVEMFTMQWFIYFVLFLAMGIVADAVVQYITLLYSKKRCKKEIEETKELQDELIQIATAAKEDDSYEKSSEKYDAKDYLNRYLQPMDHLALLTIDQGEFAKNYEPLPEAAYVVEPYSNVEEINRKFEGYPLKAMKLTPNGQMPFKDRKMDIVMCIDCNYDKFEVERVLKNDGYFIVQQNGSDNYKEFLKMLIPFGMKGRWDMEACAQTLEDIEMKIVDKIENFGTIRFHSIEAIHTYFKRVSPDLANMNKYKNFYMVALKSIKENHFYELTTHHFLVVAQKKYKEV